MTKHLDAEKLTEAYWDRIETAIKDAGRRGGSVILLNHEAQHLLTLAKVGHAQAPTETSLAWSRLETQAAFKALSWIIENPGAHPANVQVVARKALPSQTPLSSASTGKENTDE